MYGKGVPMTLTAEDQLVFENEEWLVTEGGLEHKRTGYFIERASLGSRRSDGLWSWPLHMAEKQWCTLAPFTEAFTCAAASYGLGLDTDFAHSFKAARCEIVGRAKAERAAPRAAFGVASDLRTRDRTPISRESIQADNEWRSEGRSEFLGFVLPERDRPPAARARQRSGSGRASTAWRWRAPRPIRKASTRLVRLLQAALYPR